MIQGLYLSPLFLVIPLCFRLMGRGALSVSKGIQATALSCVMVHLGAAFYLASRSPDFEFNDKPLLLAFGIGLVGSYVIFTVGGKKYPDTFICLNCSEKLAVLADAASAQPLCPKCGQAMVKMI